jgi:biotin synthase-related radical SAM superfamily protein
LHRRHSRQQSSRNGCRGTCSLTTMRRKMTSIAPWKILLRMRDPAVPFAVVIPKHRHAVQGAQARPVRRIEGAKKSRESHSLREEMI